VYLAHFGLAEPPFRITPHTDFFFDGADRGTTLEALVYAVLNDEGIVKVSGEVGSGKTMLCRVLLERVPDTVETVYLANPSLTRDELLRSIADEIGITLASDGTRVAMRELFEHLIERYAQGRRVVILIDEAHAMPEDTLEQVRLLSNLESSRHKLLQIVLFGQPELDEALAKPSLRQLKDRITHSFRMRPLSEPEIATYVSFRMRAAGYRGPDVFSRSAISLIARASNGLSRRINILADKSLLAAFADGGHAVTDREARTAIRDSEFGALAVPARRWHPFAIGAGLLALGAVGGLALHRYVLAPPSPGHPPAAPAAVATPPKAAEPAPQPAPPEQPAAPASQPAAAEPVAPVAEPPKPEASPVFLTPEQEKRISTFPHGGQKLLKARLEATLERLRELPGDRVSLDLYYTDNWEAARLERFLARASDLVALEDILVIPAAGPNRYRIRVAYGAYSSREAAVEAYGRLPPKYRQSFPLEPKTLDVLRGEIR